MGTWYTAWVGSEETADAEVELPSAKNPGLSKLLDIVWSRPEYSLACFANCQEFFLISATAIPVILKRKVFLTGAVSGTVTYVLMSSFALIDHRNCMCVRYQHSAIHCMLYTLRVCVCVW